MACPEITNDCDWTSLSSADKSNKDHVTASPFFRLQRVLLALIYTLITLLRTLIYIKQSYLKKYENYYLDPSKLAVKPRPLNARPCFCPFYSISMRAERRVTASEHHRYHSHSLFYETVRYVDITASIVAALFKMIK